MKKKHSERRKKGLGKKSSSKNSVSENSRKKRSQEGGSSVAESRTTVNKKSSWSFWGIFSCASSNDQVVENAHAARKSPEKLPTIAEDSKTPTKKLDPKLSINTENHNQSSNNIGNSNGLSNIPPSTPQQEWKIGDEQKEPFSPAVDDDDTNSVAASELTMDTFFRNQETNSHNSKDRSWSAFLGFGTAMQQPSPPSSPSNHAVQRNSYEFGRSSSFFGLSFQQNGPTSNRNMRDPMGSNSSDLMDEPAPRNVRELPVDGSVSQQSSGVKPTRLQQQQASLLMRTQRSMRNSSANNTPLVDPLARPGSFRAMRSNSQTNSPAISNSQSPAVTRSPQQALVMVDGGDSDALCDIYPNQDDHMFEETKLGITGSANKNTTPDDGRFTGQNPAMKQMRNRNMLSPAQRANSTMSSSVGSRLSSPATSDLYISSSTDDEYNHNRSNNSLLSASPKSPTASRTAASSFNHPAPYYRSQSTPIQSMQQTSSFKDSPSIASQTKNRPTQSERTSGKPNSNNNQQFDDQEMHNNPLNLKKAYAAKAAQMARSGTAAGAAASAAATKSPTSSNDRPGAVKVASTDESDIEYAIMLSLQEEQKRRQLDEAERKAIEEAVQRSTFNQRPSIRLLQSKYYNSR